MTIKDIMHKVADVEEFRYKYDIKEGDVEIVLSSGGSTGKKVLRLLYTIIEKNNSGTGTLGAISNQTYKIIKTKHGI